MTKAQKESLNMQLVHVFNRILSWEEQTFRKMEQSDLSLRELHVIEAIYHLQKSGENRMSAVARYLSITPGSLTTSVNVLVKKGYVVRRASESDRRVVELLLTEKAEKVNKIHTRLHDKMIDGICDSLDEVQVDTLFAAVKNLSEYFADKCGMRK